MFSCMCGLFTPDPQTYFGPIFDQFHMFGGSSGPFSTSPGFSQTLGANMVLTDPNGLTPPLKLSVSLHKIYVMRSRPLHQIIVSGLFM